MDQLAFRPTNTYFWDGRATTLEEQALTPTRAKDELNQNRDDLARELSAIPEDYPSPATSTSQLQPDRQGPLS